MSAAVTLRRGTVDDAAVIAEVFLTTRKHAVPLIPRMVHRDDETRAWFASVVLVEREVWVAEVSGAIVALMVLRGDFVDQLHVHPDHQRLGIGTLLVARAKRQRPRGLRLYTFQTNEPARDFYEARGFKAIAFGDGTGNEEGAPDVLYEWKGLLR